MVEQLHEGSVAGGGVGAAGRQVVAVERDVDVAERDLLVEEVADQAVQAGGEVRASDAIRIELPSGTHRALKPV